MTTRLFQPPAKTPRSSLSGVSLQRKCACGNKSESGGECAECKRKKGHLQRSIATTPASVHVQPMLTVNQPGDRFEREADQVADQVMREADYGIGLVGPQRSAATVAPRMQRKSDADYSATPDVPASVYDVLSRSGDPLELGTRAFMEPRFGQDFSHVRIHTDVQASESAAAVQARAYTVANHIVFSSKEYSPHTTSGVRLLAHELTHVVQQGSGSRNVAGALRIQPMSDPTEQNADLTADRVLTGKGPLQVGNKTNPTIARKAESQCSRTYRPAKRFGELIGLVRAAEARFRAAGIASIKDQIKSLRGIYYGTEWSRDFIKEQSTTRNRGFQTFTQSFASPIDPRSILDCGLFEALQASQDVREGSRQVDFGHLIIALDARNALVPSFKFPVFGGTGVEISTWLGDLGGGAGMLAVRRGRGARDNSSVVFRGSDFGGSINLEGDIAGFVVGRGGVTRADAPVVVPAGRTLADILEAYLSPKKAGTEWKERATIFLRMYGANFDSSGNLENRNSIVVMFAEKIETFACQYLLARASDGKISSNDYKMATEHLKPSSQEVAEAFVDALDESHRTGTTIRARHFPAPRPAQPGACRIVTAIGTAIEKAGQLKENVGKAAEQLKEGVERKASGAKKRVEEWLKSF